MKFTPAPHIMIAVAPYYRHITDQLISGAVAELEKIGASHDIHEVGGAYELPVAVSIAMRSRSFFSAQRRYDGYLTLGCVIRGETSHYDLICNETARALQDLAIKHQLALGFGLLTVENEAQALARADVNGKNKGAEAAIACIKTLELKAAFRLYPR